MPPTDGSQTSAIVADVLRSIDSNPRPVRLQPPLSHMMRFAAPHSAPMLRGLLFFAGYWCASVIPPIAFDPWLTSGWPVCSS
jgi:hypothetical protein